jgi:hypothetical protein
VSTTHSAEAVLSLYSVSAYLSAEYPASTYIQAKYPVSTFLPTAGWTETAAHRGSECPKASETDGRANEVHDFGQQWAQEGTTDALAPMNCH